MLKLKMMKEQFEFSITADHDEGLLQRIILLFTRKKINIDRLQFGATGTNCELICQLQCAMAPEKAANISKQIENIVVVKTVQHYRKKIKLMSGPMQLSKYPAALVNQ